MTTFSIIVPVYNVDRYLSTALDSFVNQTYRDIEIVCVDDGSTDKSPLILDRYAQMDNRIKIITQQNSGTYLARRRGVEDAHGDYIMFVDPDDWIDLNTCESLFNILEKNPVDILQYGFEIEVEGKIPSKEATNIDKFFNRQQEELTGRDSIITGSYIKGSIAYNQCGKVFRKEVVQNAFSSMPPVRCIFAEDLCSSFFIFQFTNTYRATPQRMYHYRVGVGISTKSTLSLSEYKQTLESFKMLEAIESYIERNHLPQELYSQIVNKIRSEINASAFALGYTRIKEKCQLEDWLSPFCESAKLPQTVLFIAKSMESHAAHLERKISRRQRTIKLLIILCTLLLSLLIIQAIL